MKPFFFILLFFTFSSSCQKNQLQPAAQTTMPVATTDHKPLSVRNFTYLALGDSYTVGQSVPALENYPNQAVMMLRGDSLLGKATIIATTGWTTGQLQSAIHSAAQAGSLLPAYDIVTLLIGVNNQYQGQDAAAYQPDFEALLKKSIALAGGKPAHVIVLSIPDWGYTPFGSGKDPATISKQIDAYNVINKRISEQYLVHYIDITPDTREAANDHSLLAPDGLHYSGKEYAVWAAKIEMLVKNELRQE